MLQIYCSQKKTKPPEVSDLSRHLVSPLLMPCQTWTAAISTSFMLEGVLPSLWTSEGEVGLCPGSWLCLEADLLAWGTTRRASEWVFVVLSVTLLDEIQETMNNKFFSGSLMRCCTCCTMTRCSSYLYIPASAKKQVLNHCFVQILRNMERECWRVWNCPPSTCKHTLISNAWPTIPYLSWHLPYQITLHHVVAFMSSESVKSLIQEGFYPLENTSSWS